MLIIDEASQDATSGGVFKLDKPSPADAVIDVGDGWTVEVKAGKGDILARGGQATDYSQALSESLSYAQRGLDLLSAKGVVDALITDASDLHEAWWISPQGVVLRFVVITTVMNLAAPSINVTVTDAAGNVQQSAPTPPTAWHPSLRYYRLAQVTDDLFDAYRNLYLALESVLHTIEPMKTRPNGRPGESEGDWLQRALTTADRRVNLAGYAPPGSGDPIARIIDEIYQTNRTSLFHARGTGPVFLPGEPAERQQVDEARKRLVRLYLALATEFVPIWKPSGGFYSRGFHDFIAGALDTEEGRIELHASDEGDAFNGGESLQTSGRNSKALTTRRERSLDGPFTKSFVAESEVSSLASIPHVEQIIATNKEGEVLFTFTYDQRLTLTGLHKVEVHVGLRAQNVQQPKQTYGI